MHIKCTNGTPIVNTLDHLPPLPLFVDYKKFGFQGRSVIMLTKQDELGLYRALQLHDRVRHIDLKLPPSILHKVFMFLDKHFPMLEYLSLSFSAEADITLTLPKAFLAPNLRHLTLPSTSPTRRLRFLTSTVFLVALEISNIQTSSYFRPGLLVARLQSLPQLKEMSIGFSTPIPRPSTERELLGEKGPSATLPGLKIFRFKGVGAYLESLLAQIRVPILEQLEITLFNQIAFVLPHLSRLVNITERFQLPSVSVVFDRQEVYITTAHHSSRRFERGPFFLRVMCKQLDWQIDCAAQICNSLIPTLSSVETFKLECSYDFEIPTALENGAIDGTAWHELLGSSIGVKELYIDKRLLEELSHALQVDEVGSNPGFLPNLRSISARRNLFTSFIDDRQAVGRPIAFSSWHH